MTSLSFQQLAGTYFRLCAEQRYAEARDMAHGGAGLFPNRYLYYNWLLCAAAGVSAELGLQDMSDALASGYWFDDGIAR